MNDYELRARFNQWVNGRLFGVVADLTDSEYRRDLGAFFRSIHRTLNHLLLIDHMWFSRFTGDSTEAIETASDILHDDFDALRRARKEFDEHIIRVVDSLDDEALDRRYEFTMKASGNTMSMVGRHMLLTVFNHQTHHRGQVTAMLTQLERTIPGLDMPGFIREIEA